MSDIKRLAEAAQKANAGPWFVCRQPNDDGTVNIETGRIGQSEWSPAQNCEYGTAEYIAAASPDIVLELLSTIDELRARVAELETELAGHAEAATSIQKLTRDLDWILNGEDAAPQALLCDIVSQLDELAKREAKLVAREAQPERQPMTDKQIYSEFKANKLREHMSILSFENGVRCAEAHHNIGAKS